MSLVKVNLQVYTLALNILRLNIAIAPLSCKLRDDCMRVLGDSDLSIMIIPIPESDDGEDERLVQVHVTEHPKTF
jgi:hypothetical protein